MTHDDEFELRALAGRAWEHRDEPDFPRHIDHIADWFDRRAIRADERRLRSTAAVLQVLKETA